MKRTWLWLLVSLVLIARSSADEPKTDKEKDAKTSETKAAETKLSPVEQFKAKPDDPLAFRTFMTEYIRSVPTTARDNPAAAEKKLKEMTDTLDSLGKIEGIAAQKNVKSARDLAKSLQEMIDIEKSSLPDLEAELDASPHDIAVVQKYFRKILTQINMSVRSDTKKAETMIAAAKARLDKANEGLEKDSDKQQIQNLLKSLVSPEKTLAATKKQEALIGQNSAPLEVAAWVNGSSLTDADLKGKVVLLDFWAVWCPPCVASFPHLREWQEKYSDKGLVIIGLTNYYETNDFDDEKGSLKRAKEPLAPEAEQEMLKRFAAHHKLHHRFAVQAKGSKISEYYGVTAIPHVVIIDQTGKIRMMKIGNTQENTKALDDMLESLLSKAPAAGG